MYIPKTFRAHSIYSFMIHRAENEGLSLLLELTEPELIERRIVALFNIKDTALTQAASFGVDTDADAGIGFICIPASASASTSRQRHPSCEPGLSVLVTKVSGGGITVLHPS